MKKYFLFSLVFFFLSGLYPGLPLCQEKASNATGEWSIILKFVSGIGNHIAQIQQKSDSLSGIYKGEVKVGTLKGTIKGENIDFTGSLKHEASYLQFHYTGKILGDKMEGKVDMGEYWTATWSAQRTKKK